jgi:hypothetical protein
MNVGWQRRHAEDERRIAELYEQIRQLQQQVVRLSSAATEATSAGSQSPKPATDVCLAGVSTFDDIDVESLKSKCNQFQCEKLEVRICKCYTPS